MNYSICTVKCESLCRLYNADHLLIGRVNLLVASCPFYIQNVHVGISGQCADKKNDCTQIQQLLCYLLHSESISLSQSPTHLHPAEQNRWVWNRIQFFCPLIKASTGILGCAFYNAVGLDPLIFFVQSSTSTSTNLWVLLHFKSSYFCLYLITFAM